MKYYLKLQILSLVGLFFLVWNASAQTSTGGTNPNGSRASSLATAKTKGNISIVIKRDGVDITDPKPAQSVMAGQRMNLSAIFTTKPGQKVTQQWTISGKKVKDYKQSVSSPATPGTPTTPPKPAVIAATEFSLLQPTDLTQSSLSFYWIDGSSTGTDLEAQVTVTVNGQSNYAKARFKVFCPQVVSFSGIWTTNKPRVDVGQSDPLSPSDSEIHLGTVGNTPDYGIHFEYKTDDNLPKTFSGDYEIVQLIKVDAFENNTVGQGLYFKSSDYVLDHLIAPASSDHAARDTPALRLVSPYTDASVKQDFKDYLMFKPSGESSIWIGLSKLTWNWSGAARLQGEHWILLPGTVPSDTDPNPKGSKDTTQPKWSMQLSDVRPIVTP